MPTTTNVHNGQSTTSLTLQTDDSETVFDGGRSIGTQIDYQAFEIISVGGVASATNISSGGILQISGGGIGSGTTFTGGGTEYIFSRGIASNTTVTNHGVENIETGGSAVHTTVDAGGVVYTSIGGMSLSATISAGGMDLVARDAVVSDTTIAGGQLFVYSGGSADDTTVNAGGSAVILSGGSATSTTVHSGGYQIVSGGIVSNTTVSDGGNQYVSSGGIVDSTTVDSGGTEIIFSGGETNFTTVDNGGFQYVNLSGVARGTTIETGGAQFVLSKGSAGAATVSGKQYVYSGGDASFTTVVGGQVFLYSGGVEFMATISHGGSIVVESATALAQDTTVSSGGELYIGGGSATFTTISSGGYNIVSSGVTTGTTVLKGGIEDVIGGGSAISTTVNGGGIESIFLGGTATDTDLIPGGTIDVHTLTYAGGGTASLDPATDVLTVVEGSHTYTQQMSGSYTGEYFHLAEDASDGTFITDNGLPCFCDGTRILTPSGEVAIETLTAGDQVLTIDGTARAIRWVGHRSIDPNRHIAADLVQPIIIRTDAFADGVPSRDLRLSPDHAVLLDGMLVPVKRLINGASVQRDTGCDTVIYYHLELATHDILLADNLPTESYLDTGNRGQFENAGAPIIVHPIFGKGQARRVAEFCRPLVEDDEAMEQIWRRIAMRALMLGLSLPAEPETTADPDLRIAVGGRLISPASDHAERYVFVLPSGRGQVRLVSRAATPCEGRPWIDDRRRLGVMVSQLALRRGDAKETIPLSNPLLDDGWWAVEGSPQRPWRWTDGDAVLPVRCDKPVVLEVELAGTMAYPLESFADDTPERSIA